MNTYYNSIKSILFIALTGLIMSAKSENIIIEAESGVYDYLIETIDSSASENKYLALKDSGTVFWNCKIAKAGYYSVKVKYRAFNGSKEQLLIKNGVEIPIGFSMAENWNEFNQPFYLLKGENELGIKSSWGHMDIDYISFEPFEPTVDIAPLKQILYEGTNRKLCYKIDNYHQNITSVRIDGNEIPFEVIQYPYQENARWLILEPNLPAGDYLLNVALGESKVESEIEVKASVPKHGLTIIAPDVEHGASVLICLPSGKNMLVDTGKEWVRDSIIIPMLKRNGIDTIHTLMLTHHHGDHDSGDRGKAIIEQFNVQDTITYHSFETGHVLKIDGVEIKFLNGFADGEEENKRSIAFTLNYKGFVYNHGGDTYAVNQQRMLDDFSDENKAHVFFANHHFHGSLLPAYIHKVNPDVVLLQSQEAVYARSAYMENYVAKSEQVLNVNRKKPIETILALELGATIISVIDSENWWYSTYKNQDDVVFPELKYLKDDME